MISVYKVLLNPKPP